MKNLSSPALFIVALAALACSLSASASPAAAAPSPQQASASTSTEASKSSASSTKKKKTRRRSSKREPFQKAPTPDRISEIQSALARGGYYQGEPNGKWDSNTVAALEKFQSDNGMNASGKLDAPSLQKLGLGSSTAGVDAPRPPSHASPATTTSSVPASSTNSASASTVPVSATASANAANSSSGTGKPPQR
jgi:peptidoglycan hydrolase-like protein with peptidoglycan-binding domain